MEVVYIIDYSCFYLILLDHGSITKSMQKLERGMREMLFCINRHWVSREGPQLITVAEALGLKSWSCREPCRHGKPL